MSPSEPNFILTPDDGAPRSIEQLRRQALRLLQQSGADEARDESAASAAHSRIDPAPAPPAAARAVMIGVVTMPAVFIVVVMGALALFGKPATPDKASPRVAAVETLAQPGGAPAVGVSLAAAKASRAETRPIMLGEDMRVADISLDGDRVALHVESPMGEEIVIYDFARGEVVAEAPIETASVEAVDALAMLTGAPLPGSKPVAAIAGPAPEILATAAPIFEARAPATPGAPSMKPRRSN
jgi:hypothetical protein